MTPYSISALPSSLAFFVSLEFALRWGVQVVTILFPDTIETIQEFGLDLTRRFGVGEAVLFYKDFSCMFVPDAFAQGFMGEIKTKILGGWPVFRVFR